MTLKRKFAEVGDQLVVPAPGAAPKTPAGDSPARTAPGQMIAFRQQMSDAASKITELEARLETFEGSLPMRKLDAQTVHPSVMSNRHAKSFDSAEFQALKREIESAQGNVQPIKVRPLTARPGHFEIVFGHRRHRACLELGLPVLAAIEELSDAQMFVEMDRENRARADLSPYELGVMYKRALKEKLWPSQRQMAEALDVTQALISQALLLVDLPPAVVAAFRSPLELQYRWGKELAARLQSDPDGVLRRASEVAGMSPRLSGKQVFDYLMGATTHSAKRWIEVNGKKVGEVEVANTGRVTISLAPNTVDIEAVDRLTELVQGFVAKAA